MKLENNARLFVILAFIFLKGILPVFGEVQNVSIQSIIYQWAAIERELVEAGVDDHLAGITEKAGLLDDVARFRESIQSYLGSEMYRIYRFAPLSSETPFGRSSPNETPEIRAAADLTFAFGEAVSNGDWEKAVLISTDISGNLILAMIRDEEAGRFAGAAYFRLLLVFIVFIALTAFVIWVFSRELVSSFRREAEGAVFTHAVLLAQEDERARISRELHDTVAQDLRYLSLEMNKIGKTEEMKIREKLCAEAASMQAALIRKVRDICDYLVPPDFRFQGLPDALRRLCLDFGKRTGIDCRIDITEDIKIDFLDNERQLQIFRIVQEALANVEKHAEATEAIVMLRCDANGIYVGVSDDGKGFDPSGERGERDIYSGAHLGIRGMNERAALLGGSLEIKSERGEGTMVRLELPAREGGNVRSID
ncbi:MAG: sensor histidine kinase [Treponema sp.]|jgi:signal transduction histidine kinase|nr:sensor histidine kinase [Treponema sp.]